MPVGEVRKMITAKETNKIATAVSLERKMQNLIDLDKEIEGLEKDILEAAHAGKFAVEIHFPCAKFESLTWAEQLKYIGIFLNQLGYSVSPGSRHHIQVSWD